jgi:ribosomal protein L7/L12
MGRLALLAFAVLLLVLVLRARAASADDESPRIDPDTATDGDVARLVSAGRKIDAIRVYRRLHRTDLKTAKEAVDALAKTLPGRER